MKHQEQHKEQWFPLAQLVSKVHVSDSKNELSNVVLQKLQENGCSAEIKTK